MNIQNKTKLTGFTLIELIIVVGIIGILTTVAIPSYLDSIQKARRADAMDSALDCAAAQARYFSTQSPSTYFQQAEAVADGFCNSDGTNLNSKEGYYRLTVTHDNPAGCTTNLTNGNTAYWCFRVEAVPAPGSPQLEDDTCQAFSVDHRGNRIAEDDAGNDTTDSCWRS